MKIAVRMDDITPGMDRQKFNEFKALLEEYRIRPLIGVVPDNQDENLNRDGLTKQERNAREEDFWKEVRRLKESGWTVALHGYRHVYTKKTGGMFPLNRFSEFAGVPVDEQRRMLENAVEQLASHGITTDIFMAPAHSYDKNTLRVLKELGINKITDGFGKAPYRYTGMTFYPIAFRLESSRKKKGGVTTMVVHTNTMEDADIKRYREIFESGQVISYEEYLGMPVFDRKSLGHAGEYLLAVLKHLLVKLL